MRRRRAEDDTTTVPFPTVPVSNGEWLPRPITRRQRLAATLIAEECDRRARHHGMTRGEFLRTAAATATAFMVLNRINGLDQWGDAAAMPVRREHCDDLDAARELLDRRMFVMDVQSHHIDVPAVEQLPDQIANTFRFLRFRPSDLPFPESLSQMSYLREMFLDSQTSVAVMSGLPNRILELPAGVPIGPAAMAATRDVVNELAGSPRCLSQAIIDPMRPAGEPTALDSLESQVRDLGAASIKSYTYNGNWRLDDAVGRRMIEDARALGVNLINVHKGLPLSQFLVMSPEYVRATDIPVVARDYPDMNFCAYHSAFFQAGDHPEGLDAGYQAPGEAPNPGRWGSMEFLQLLDAMPRYQRRNVYVDIGSTFGFLLGNPDQLAHFMGRLLRTMGSRNILWGTDSIWWGSPQFLIDAFMRLQIPAPMRRRFGYPQLTVRAKRRILGLNAARLYGVKRRDRRMLCTIPEDRLAQLQEAQGGFRAGRSLRVYGPQTRRQFFALFGPQVRRV